MTLQIPVQGPAGLVCVDDELGFLSPAKTFWAHDSFTVPVRKLSPKLLKKRLLYMWRYIEVTDMTGNHFYLYVSLIQLC